MADFGRVFEGALSAIFAGYVFYILFALWPEYRDRRVLSPYISKKIHFLVNDCISILKEIEHASGHGLPLGQVSRRQIEAACKAASTAKGPRTVIGQAGMPATWMEYFANQRGRSLQTIDSMYGVSKFLSPELISLITEIEDCDLFGFVGAVQHLPFGNPDLSVFREPVADYAQTCRRLARWHDHALTGAALPTAPKLN